MTAITEKDVRDFYKTLIGKGENALEPSSPFYVPIFESQPQKDPIRQLCSRISWAESQSVNLLTGFRGNGKSTQLKRLKQLLEAEDCHVMLIDMTQFVLMTKPLEIGDFILSLMTGLTEVCQDSYAQLAQEYWQRFVTFLRSEVKIESLEVGVDASKVALQLKTDPTFKNRIQEHLRGHITTLVKEANAYVAALVTAIRLQSNNPDKKVVLLVDSLEQLRGVGSDAHSVHDSVQSLFAGQAGNLRFNLLHVVYTVPPFLIPLMPNPSAILGGSAITQWPNIHVRDKHGQPDPTGLQLMRDLISKRYAHYASIISTEQLDELACASGGDIRDYFRLIRETLISCANASQYQVTPDILQAVQAKLRHEMLPIAADDGRWLYQIRQQKDAALANIDELPRLTRFLDSNLIMNYLNGEPWCDIHPLLISEVDKYAPNP